MVDPPGTRVDVGDASCCTPSHRESPQLSASTGSSRSEGQEPRRPSRESSPGSGSVSSGSVNAPEVAMVRGAFGEGVHQQILDSIHSAGHKVRVCMYSFDDPEVVDAISEGVARVQRANCCAGGFVPRDRAGVQWLLELGMGFITFDVDSSILGTAVADVVEWFRLDAD